MQTGQYIHFSFMLCLLCTNYIKYWILYCTHIAQYYGIFIDIITFL
nr:MAG TPA: hypothetical protein [Caudoviricetes sp.]